MRGKEDCCFLPLKIHTKRGWFIIHLVERNILTKAYSSELFETKYVSNSILIQEFPAQCKLMFLSIKKRRSLE